MFELKHYRLPHDGIIPGAAGHKKQTIPTGTKVYCIVYGTKMYWCAYLDEADALCCKRGLEEAVSGTARRSIDLDALVAWNFKSAFPKRIYRPKELRS